MTHASEKYNYIQLVIFVDWYHIELDTVHDMDCSLGTDGKHTGQFYVHTNSDCEEKTRRALLALDEIKLDPTFENKFDKMRVVLPPLHPIIPPKSELVEKPKGLILEMSDVELKDPDYNIRIDKIDGAISRRFTYRTTTARFQ